MTPPWTDTLNPIVFFYHDGVTQSSGSFLSSAVPAYGALFLAQRIFCAIPVILIERIEPTPQPPKWSALCRHPAPPPPSLPPADATCTKKMPKFLEPGDIRKRKIKELPEGLLKLTDVNFRKLL